VSNSTLLSLFLFDIARLPLFPANQAKREWGAILAPYTWGCLLSVANRPAANQICEMPFMCPSCEQ
jgi:hypothetical protein